MYAGDEFREVVCLKPMKQIYMAIEKGYCPPWND